MGSITYPITIYILIQWCGIMPSLDSLANHCSGPITILLGFALSHAPHQEKVLFAMMLLRQRPIKCKW